jgi:hypothetical protein
VELLEGHNETMLQIQLNLELWRMVVEDKLNMGDYPF